MENKPIKFAEGMMFKARSDNAPETVRGSIYFKVSEFIKFLETNKDEKGWVHTKMMKSKEKGTIYFILDEWRPTPIKDGETGEVIPDPIPAPRTLSDEQKATMSVEQVADLSDIPF